MSFEIHRLQPRENRYLDLAFIDNGQVVTVAVWKKQDYYYSNWWVSGLTKAGELRFLAGLELAIPATSYVEAENACGEIYKEFVRPLVSLGQQSNGIPEPRVLPPVDVRKELALTHLRYHDLAGTITQFASGKRERAAFQFQLIKSFGYSAATPLMAEYEDVPKTTIVKRLWLAREAGLLPKMSDAADSNEVES